MGYSTTSSWRKNSEYQNLFSPLNDGSIPVGMVPFTESLKDTYDRVVPFYEKLKLKKSWKMDKNILISAHGNSLKSIMQIFI